MTTDCPIPGCTAGVKRGQLMCREHWFATPVPLRTAVGKAWRNFVKAELGPEKLDAINTYRVARDAAIGHVTQAQAPVVAE